MSTLAVNPSKPRTGIAALFRHMDALMAVGIVGVIFVLVVPLPTPLLDMLLCCQLALSFAVLLGTIYCSEPLEFSGFPPMLLMITLFRLALNVATARLILLNANAGQVISAFGQFVVGGNYVVGFTIFMILIIIQFVVITKGAGRVAEVAARFTLDAMPGKQMAIDADLNAGLIDENQARFRRHKIEREANFYGAMDGATKFVRGDAIAALIITGVNLLGGLAIGVLQRGMDIGDSLHTFALLSIGDGLVTQIPALLISTASGILVTRGASDNSLGEDFSRQLFTRPKSLKITATFLGILACVPGLPPLPLLAMAGGAWFLSVAVARAQAASAQKKTSDEAGAKAAKGPHPDSPEAQLHLDLIELELGSALLPLVNKTSGDLLTRISQIRKKLAGELGIILPSVRVRDNLQLSNRHYRVKIRGAVIAEQELYPDRLMAINPGSARPGLEGLATTDPAFSLPALWINTSQRVRGEAYGYTVVEPISVLATHLQELLRSHAADLLTRQDVQKVVDRLKEAEPGLVKDLIPGAITLAVLHRVLQGLLKERVPIRDMTTILEVLGDYAGQQLNIEQLTANTREALAPSFVGTLLDDQNKIFAVACEPALESKLIQSVVQSERGPLLVLMPEHVTALVKRLNEEINSVQRRKHKPILLCSTGLRVHLRRLLERVMPSLPILSYTEVPRRATLEIVAQIPATVLGSGENLIAQQRANEAAAKQQAAEPVGAGRK
jgi:flagellar biosynthesis protein FlhA